MSKIFYVFLLSRMSVTLASSLYVVTFIWTIQNVSNTSVTAFTYTLLGLSTLFILPLGDKIDRLKPGILNLYSVILQLVILSVLVIFFNQFLQGEMIFLIVSLVFIASISMDIYTPSSNALFTQLVNEKIYKKGNSIIQTSDQVLNLVAYIFIAILISTYGERGTLLVSLVLLVIGVVLNFIVTVSSKKREVKKDKRSFFVSMKIGFYIILQNNILKFTIPIAIFSNIIIAIIIALLPGISEQKGIYFYTLVYVTFFLGFIIGAFLSNKINETLKNIYLLGIFNGIILLTFALSINSYLSLLPILLFGAVSGIINIFDETIYQTNTPKNEMGNVLTIKRVVLSLAYPIGSTIAGVLAFSFSIESILLITAFFKIIFDILLLLVIKKYII